MGRNDTDPSSSTVIIQSDDKTSAEGFSNIGDTSVSKKVVDIESHDIVGVKLRGNTLDGVLKKGVTSGAALRNGAPPFICSRGVLEYQDQTRSSIVINLVDQLAKDGPDYMTAYTVNVCVEYGHRNSEENRLASGRLFAETTHREGVEDSVETTR